MSSYQDEVNLVTKIKEIEVNTDINNRGENGVDHHPKSVEIMNKLDEEQKDYLVEKKNNA